MLLKIIIIIRAEIPAVKEQQGLSRNDGKRPDGLTLVPWQSDGSTTWDVTLAASYVSQSVIQAVSAATAASERKTAKYSNLSSSYVFCPVAVETLGTLADDALVFLAEIGRRAMLYPASRSAGNHVLVPAYFSGDSAG